MQPVRIFPYVRSRKEHSEFLGSAAADIVRPIPKRLEGIMYKEFGAVHLHETETGAELARSGRLSALVALEEIGVRRSFARDEEIYAEGAVTESWFRVVSGTVRVTKLLTDGRRPIAGFCFAGDCFGLDNATLRSFSAEAVDGAVVMRYPRAATDRLLLESPHFARHFCDLTLRDLAHAQGRMLLLGRLTAPERVASFLLELSDRRDMRLALDVPMSRNDIADYLGLTIETVCRVLSAFKRDGVIAIPTPHRVELRKRDMLEALCEA
jgi:CRP/FNR family nitrogen fixation transcriptional regulator